MPRKKLPQLWSHSAGPRGSTVRIHESRRGGPLRWDIRMGGPRQRPIVHPEMRVRTAKNAPPDPVLVQQAIDLCERRYAELTLAGPLRARILTVGKAFALFHDPRRNALPKSQSALVHHRASRAFWCDELGKDVAWNDVVPADVTAALMRLRDEGKVETALKRMSNLRTLQAWLVDEMEMDVKNILRGASKLKRRIRQNYEPVRPHLTDEQRAALRKVLAGRGWRSHLFFALLMSSGTRSVQARTAMRSMLNDARLQPAPPKGMAPHGWLLFRAVKGQVRHLTFLTRYQRRVIDDTLAGPLAAWEAQYQAGELADYPLVPAGRIDRDQLRPEPISDRALRDELERHILPAAGIEKVAGDRLGFHAIRRSWANAVNAKLGRSAAKSAGGWSDEDMVEVYLSRYQPEHIESVRKLMEREEGE